MAEAVAVTKPVVLLLLLLLLGLAALCKGQSGDGSSGDDEDYASFKNTYACENGMLGLECPQNHVIRIVRANFGRFSLKTCNPTGITSNMNLRCQSITASDIVANECDGHNRCEFRVSIQLFGDPCPGTSKYADVKYYCEAVEKDHIVTLRPLPGHPQLTDRPPLRPSVPVPEAIKVCVHQLSRNPVYDIYWTIPESSQRVLQFLLQYSVPGNDVFEKLMVNPTELGERRFAYTFTPDDSTGSKEHLFSIKGHSMQYGWGDYSDFVAPEICPWRVADQVTTPTTTTTTTTTTTPRPPDVLCGPTLAMGVHWPPTIPNGIHTVMCPKHLGNGVMRYKCLHNGEWDPNGPEVDQCYMTTQRPPAPSSTTARTTSTSTTTATTTTTEEGVAHPLRKYPQISDLLNNLTQPGYDMSASLPALTRNMSREINGIRDPVRRKAVADHFKESLLAMTDEMLTKEDVWSSMKVSQQRSTAASMLDSVERAGLLAAANMRPGEVNTTRRANVVMQVMNVQAGQPAVLDSKPPPGSMSKVNQFTIPAGVLQNLTNRKIRSVPVVFVVMSSMSQWLRPEPIGSVDTNIIDTRPRSEPILRMVNSDIVTASVSNIPLKDLAEPVVFLMEHRQVEAVENPKCSFWDTDRSEWSSEGCWLHDSNRTHTTCKCSHLTSFAVLMDITGATLLIPRAARFSLELMTYIGCTISIICLMLSWVTFACFKSLDCDRNTIHKHLVFCLMVAQIVLVIGIHQTDPPVLCSVIAGVLHFFFLASFAWMCLEGVQLYVMLVEVFESERSRVLWYYLFGYGAPAVIVTVSAAVFPAGYGTEFHCWLTVERGFIWSFVGPALAVMLVNIVMLGIAISIMVRHSNMSHSMRQKTVPQKMSVSGSMYSMETPETHIYHRPEIPTHGYQCLTGARYSMGGSSSGYGVGGYGVGGGGAGGSSHLYSSIDHLELLSSARSTRQQHQSWIKGAVVLVVLLGLTWVFGVLYLDNGYQTLVFSVIFTLLNTLQGLFIFLFHCLFNEKVQKEYRRLVRHTECLPDCLRVRYGGASSSGSRENSSSGNVMSRFLRGKKKKDNVDSGNSAQPFLHKGRGHLSSSAPSSSDGATSSHLSSDTSNNNQRKSSRSSTVRSNGGTTTNGGPNGGRFSNRPLEVDGIVGDLSEALDCSRVDSEFVSEYCQQNMRVSNEVKRYSTASEDSGRGVGERVEEEEERREGGVRGAEEEDLDRLAALSVESLSNHHQPYFGDNRSEGWADSDNVDGDDDEHEYEVPRPLNGPAINNPVVCGYVPPPLEHRPLPEIVMQMDSEEEEENGDEDSDDGGYVNAHDDEEEEDGLVDGEDDRRGGHCTPPPRARAAATEVQPLMKQTDSERVLINNAVNKPREMPRQSHTSSSSSSPKHSPSLTNVDFPGEGGEGDEAVAADSAPSHTSVPCLKFKPCVSAPPPSENGAVDQDRDAVTSLPNLSNRMGGPSSSANHYSDVGQSPSVKRHSSDGHMYFSPFRFSASDC